MGPRGQFLDGRRRTSKNPHCHKSKARKSVKINAFRIQEIRRLQQSEKRLFKKNDLISVRAASFVAL